MANYIKPPMDSLPFVFGAGGYSKPNFDELEFNFRTRAITNASSYFGASINALSPGQDYIKSCPTYVVGYGRYGVQIIKGRCIYGGIRDLHVLIKGVYSNTSDMPATIVGYDKISASEDLPAHLKVLQTSSYNLTASIAGGYPVDLNARIRAWGTGQEDLAASIRGYAYKNLPASLHGLKGHDLNAAILPVPGVDLSAYIKVYPQEILPASVYGWDSSDLGAYISMFQSGDMGATIGAHQWVNLGARVKGWGREEPRDLSANILGLTYGNLPASIRATYLTNLPSSIYPIVPKDLSANLYSWDTKNLTAYINGPVYLYEIGAYINPVGGFYGLDGYINPIAGTGYDSLPSRISAFWQRALAANVNAIEPGNLPAYLNATDTARTLRATIYPKIVKLTTVMSFITMNSSDMSAVINICGGSASSNLSSSIYINHISDLNAYVIGTYSEDMGRNLSASIGRDSSYTVVDKLPLSINMYGNVYKVIDKMVFNIRMNMAYSGVSAYINGIKHSADLSASIGATYLDIVSFNSTKSRERVYTLSDYGRALSFEVAEISFKSIVEEYFYVTAANKAYRTNMLDKWITDVKSYIPKEKRLNIKRRFHKMRSVYNLSKFSSIDEAIRFAIDYVTSYPEASLGAQIASKGTFNNLTSYIVGTTT